MTFDQWWDEQVERGTAECSEGMARFVWAAATAAERERCAKVAERVGAGDALNSEVYAAEAVANEVARAIRAGG